ncbi:MAG: Ig-like domain-containing protein [Ruminococcus sp.]|nr:Ig-like domain-containing protein [Ruminococcus sp.]
MDNRRRVTRKVLRQRQLGALAVIAFVVLLFVVLLAKCTKNMGEGSSSKAETTTTTVATEPVVTAPPETTTEVTTVAVNPKASNVKLSKRELFLEVGETDVPIIQAYPDAGTSESDEVWKSLDPAIAVVNASGYITGVSKGQTYIVLSFKNYPDIEIEIKVNVGGVDAPAVATTSILGADGETVTTTTTVAAGIA